MSVTSTSCPPELLNAEEQRCSTTEPNGLKPHVIVSEADERSLTRLAVDALRRSPDVSEELLAEIERAHIEPGSLVPPGVVEMGSIVEFRQEGGRTWRVQLRYPGQANHLMPIRTALFGLAEGQSMDGIPAIGRTCHLTVTSVRTESGTEPTSELLRTKVTGA